MKTTFRTTRLLGTATLGWLLLAGCESTGDGSSQIHGGMYYGAGFYDPWYYGGYYNDPDIIVTPPPSRPDIGARPSHPIARPPSAAPRPMPSIPSRPMPRGR